MTDSSPKDNKEQELDNQLADFADQLMNEKNTATQSDPEVVGDVQNVEVDEELEELKQTLLSLKSAIKAAKPDPVTAARIEKRLKIGWNSRKESWWKSILNAIPQSPRLQFTLAASVIAVLFVAIIFAKPGTGNLTGAAFDAPVLPVLLLVFIVIVIIVILRRDHS